MKHLLLAIFCLFAVRYTVAQTVHAQSFDSAALADCLLAVPEGASLLPAEEGGSSLLLDASVNSVTLMPIPVTGETKYRLAFRARTEGIDTVEVNDRAHLEMLRTRGRFLPACEVDFLDAAGEPVKRFGYAPGGAILTAEWHPYVLVFHTPPGTAALHVRFLPRKRALHVDAVELAVDDEDRAVNPNPDFRYGELNYCGWQPARDGRLYTRPDGKTVLKSGYAGISPAFPLREGVTYSLYGRGERQVSNGWLDLGYYDADGKRLGSRFLLRPTPEGSTVELVPPPGTRYGSVAMYSVILEEFRVTELAPPAP